MEEIFFLVFFVLGDFDMLNEVDKDLSFLVSLISVTMSIRISFNINLRTLPFFSAASTVTCCCCQSNSKTVTLRFYWHLSATKVSLSRLFVQPLTQVNYHQRPCEIGKALISNPFRIFLHLVIIIVIIQQAA
jgi:hypothetical protein